MRTKVLIIAIVTIVAMRVPWILSHQEASAAGFDRTQNVLPVDVRKVLDTGERFVLVSLDPTHRGLRGKSDPPLKETFHNYAVLGRTEIHDQKQRAKLLRALYKGIADGEGGARCFNPRHGISASLAGETVDLVICFECLSIKTYAKDEQVVLTTSSPQPTFNHALKKAGLPIAKEK